MGESKIPIQGIYERLQMTPRQITEFCQKWDIQNLAVFGSILREDFHPENSDIDFLFCHHPHANRSLLRRVKMKIELETLCARPVDLVMLPEVLASHNPYRRESILKSARLIYGER